MLGGRYAVQGADGDVLDAAERIDYSIPRYAKKLPIIGHLAILLMRLNPSGLHVWLSVHGRHILSVLCIARRVS